MILLIANWLDNHYFVLSFTPFETSCSHFSRSDLRPETMLVLEFIRLIFSEISVICERMEFYNVAYRQMRIEKKKSSKRLLSIKKANDKFYRNKYFVQDIVNSIKHLFRIFNIYFYKVLAKIMRRIGNVIDRKTGYQINRRNITYKQGSQSSTGITRPKVYLHMGANKTASTSIQCTLAAPGSVCRLAAGIPDDR